jgi:AcrR family transcriptional regulator
MPGGTLRERQRAETRAVVLDAALDLFEAKGYEHTTVEDIAAEAGISSRTFFRYFDSKTELLFDHGAEHDEDLEGAKSSELLAAIVARPPAETIGEALATVLREQLVHMFDDGGRKLRQLRVILADPSLRLQAHDGFHEHRPDLAKAFAARLGQKADDLAPRVLAAAFTETIWIILERWAADGADATRLPDLIDDAFAAISTGLG